MKSLFAKILIWLFATVTVTMASLLITAAITLSSPGERHMPFATLSRMQFRQARYAYETGGRQELRSTMDRLFRDSGMRGVLTDTQGKDLLTGEDYSALIRRAKRRHYLPLRSGRWIVLDRRDPAGRYWFLLFMPRMNWVGWFLHSRFLVVFGVAFFLCYLLANHLTAPVRRLREAVERFGQGDLRARVNSTRADELGDLARTFDRMADRIETLVAAERRLLLDISHELRSPLARLAVAAELARSPDQREAALRQIEKESERMNALVGELLSMTRAEGDPATLDLEPLRLDELVEEILSDVAIEARESGCRIEFEREAATEAPAEPELLRRAIENVIRNAIRHAPPGTAVTVSLAGRNGSVVLTVRDRGPGVPEEALSRIFDPFFRVEEDRDRASGGTGLGLSIARRAIELHRGHIRAWNANPGLAVEMELPGARG